MLKLGLASFFVAFLAWYWFTNRVNNGETFRGKNVVICGGSAGVGEQIAYRFCEQGANVLIVARREWALKNVVKNCSRLGAASASYITADLSGGGIGNRHLLNESLKHFQSTVDVLVLNHVYYEVKRWQGDRNFVISDVAKAFDINVFSYIDLATLFLPSLQASRGRLLVISSGLGVITYPYFALYCSNKHALHGFFNALRQDLALEKNELSITLTVLGAIATESALKVSSGNPVAGTSGWTRHSPVDASHAIVEASLHRERQVYFPSSFKFHEFASTHFPEFTESLIRYLYGLELTRVVDSS